MNPRTLFDLVFQWEYQTGFVTGILAVIALLLVRKGGWLLFWGIAAIGALAWSGLLTTRHPLPAWAPAAVVVTVLGAAFSFRVLMRKAPAWAVGALFALWVLGVWGTVPDTERAGVAMGVTTALIPCLLPALRIRVGWEGVLLAAGALGFVAVADGAARPISIVGALGMAGMPVAAAVASRRIGKQEFRSPLWLLGAMATHVIVCGRVVSRMSDLQGALVVSVLSALATGAGLVLLVESRGRLRPDP